MASEATALSTELRGRVFFFYNRHTVPIILHKLVIVNKIEIGGEELDG